MTISSDTTRTGICGCGTTLPTLTALEREGFLWARVTAHLDLTGRICKSQFSVTRLPLSTFLASRHQMVRFTAGSRIALPYSRVKAWKPVAAVGHRWPDYH